MVHLPTGGDTYITALMEKFSTDGHSNHFAATKRVTVEVDPTMSLSHINLWDKWDVYSSVLKKIIESFETR